MSHIQITTIHQVKGKHHTGTVMKDETGVWLYESKHDGSAYALDTLENVRNELNDIIEFVRSLEEPQTPQPAPRKTHAFLTDEDWSRMSNWEYAEWRTSATGFIMRIYVNYTKEELDAYSPSELRSIEKSAQQVVTNNAKAAESATGKSV